MNVNSVIVFIIVTMLWAFISFQKKVLLKDFNFIEVGLGNFVVILMLVIVLYITLSLMGKFNINRILNMTPTQASKFLICGILVFSGGLGINYLLSNRDATTIVPMLKAGMIISTLVLGCLIYSEKITLRKITASILAIMAVVILFDEK